jgi:hypothetical protein
MASTTYGYETGFDYQSRLIPAPTDDYKDTKKMVVNVDETTESGPRHFPKFDIFYTLAITTILTCLLVAANSRGWHLTGKPYQVAINNRASVQIVVQILANFLGLIHVTAICRLINYATRIYFSESAISLDSMRAWIALSVARMELDLPIEWLLPLTVFITFTLVPSALWAGAITPISITTVVQGSLLIPSYQNVSLIKEYPAQPEASDTSPFIRNGNGLFTYNVGVQFTGQLLANAASSTTTIGNQRQHAKFDNTKYTYDGRSYGVGSAVGLGDNSITNNSLAMRYTYQEVGYAPQVSCIYNMSSALTMYTGDHWEYIVKGYLPDSPPGIFEYNTYVGTNDNDVVAISVSSSDLSTRRYISILAGSTYSQLNSTQCRFDFNPMLFNVSVDVTTRNVSVVPVTDIEDFDPERNLTRTAVQQIGQISVVETNLYISQVGNALNSSIAGWNVSNPGASNENATLAGLENAFVAIMDDILAAYGSAQFVVGGFNQSANAEVHVSALRFGSSIYINAIFTINAIILLAFAIEAGRTRGWKKLMDFDYLDSRALVLSSSMGGHELADSISNAGRSVKGGIGHVLVKLQTRNEMVAIQYAGVTGIATRASPDKLDEMPMVRF